MTFQHTFDVIRPQGSTVYNYANPVRRDVVATGTGSASDNVTIRFQTDNAGPCECRNIRIFLAALTLEITGFLHCHIDWHLEA